MCYSLLTCRLETGLSQEHNLYFVAYSADIYVYVPRFPTQFISREPVLIVQSQPTSSGLRGYLDTRQPHSVNHLLCQRLGNDEVVATVRDDGDVDAVLVRHIVQAIERRSEPESTIGVVADEVRPIFQSNVGISAWGLAIHSEARILATSSNAHEVRVFKFGLLHDGDDENPATAGGGAHSDIGVSPHQGDETTQRSGLHSNVGDRLHGDADTMQQHRRMDVTQRVLNGNANIPCIAFCNTGDDLEARWLLTTDVSGYCRVIDLHAAQDADVTVQQFRFGRSFMSQGGGFDRINAGWTLMFLDPRSFHSENNFQAAVGLADDGSLPGGQAMNVTWDLSDTVDLVADESTARLQRERRDGAARQADQSRGAPNPTHDDIPMEEAGSDGAVQHYASETLMSAQMEIQAMDHLNDSIDEDTTSDSADDISDHGLSLLDSTDAEDEGTEDSISFSALYGGKRVFGNQPYFYHNQGLCNDLPCPILHASVKNIYLLQPSNQQHAVGPFSPPMVGMANPLRPVGPGGMEYYEMFDRMNMTAYIPTLGVVVIASQKGRAVVVALTKLSRMAHYPAEMQGQRRKTNYAMRIERILPLACQEVVRERPFMPLLGIATAPVQGAGHKRWRLVMMYQDHSVFSYEIARPRARDCAVDVAGVFV